MVDFTPFVLPGMPPYQSFLKVGSAALLAGFALMCVMRYHWHHAHHASHR
jgi:hypothetical protein